MSLPETSLVSTTSFVFTTGIAKALAALGDMAKDVLPKFNTHRTGQYFPL
jgi:hypothetical protein